MIGRRRFLLDRDWRFALGHAADPKADFDFVRDRSLVKAGEGRGAASPTFDDSTWIRVDVPHDWALDLPLDPNGDKELADHGFHAIGPDHPKHSVGWYRRTFDVPADWVGRRIALTFDGVFRDSILWVNGHRVGRHESGYTSFRHDVTDVIEYGARNVIAMRVDASCYEGWWYEGAGIYRHVWLDVVDPVHVPAWTTFVRSDLGPSAAQVIVETAVHNEGDAECDAHAELSIVDPDGRRVASQRVALRLDAWSQRPLSARFDVADPRLWSCEMPHIYTLDISISVGGRIVDSERTTFGLREFRWDADRGFFLNGQPLKIKGTCNHQHHAGLGAALPDALHEWKLAKLKAMGSNAYRCSHYAVAPELLDACDRLGLLVMAENRLAGSSEHAMAELDTQVRRDRNHASIFLWSLANEEHSIQWEPVGERIGRSMVRRIKSLDSTRAVTTAMHDKGLGSGLANVVDVHGWNYMKVGNIAEFHRLRPDRPIVGSEESSVVSTRGVYADDKPRGYVQSYDRRTPGWGMTAEKWWSFSDANAWHAGGFVWTGFDYFGEPIPYQWPCTASHFGLMDLCGFPKDVYWYYRAWWGGGDVLHVFPHWNWPGREGQPIEVWAYSNAEAVELFVNSRSVGCKAVERNGHVAWHVAYEPGAIKAVSYRDGREVLRRTIETTGAAERLVLEAETFPLRANGEDIAIVNVYAVDAAGRFVPTADVQVYFEIAGPARLLGVGNGDPSSHEPDRAPTRKLFSGRAMLILGTTDAPGTISIEATADAMKPTSLTLEVEPASPRPFLPASEKPPVSAKKYGIPLPGQTP